MEKLEWVPVFYNGHETNVEVTKCGRVRRVRVDWMERKSKIGEVDFERLKISKYGYRQIGIQIKDLPQRMVGLHQLIASVFLGYKWNGLKRVVMHLDDNPLNNNLSNLKIGTHRENCSQAKTKKSGLPVGVYFNKQRKKYQSQIIINGKNVYLGCYKTIEEASQAYQNKLKSL